MIAAWTRWGRTPSRRRPVATGGMEACSIRSQAGTLACWATMWTLERLQCTRWVCCWLLHFTQGAAPQLPSKQLCLSPSPRWPAELLNMHLRSWPPLALSQFTLTQVHHMQTTGSGYDAAPTGAAAGRVPATGGLHHGPLSGTVPSAAGRVPATAGAHHGPISGTVPSGPPFQGDQMASDYPSGTSQGSAMPDGLASSQTAGGLTGPSTHQTGAGMGQSSGAALGGSNVAMPGANGGGHLHAIHADTPIISSALCPWLLQA